MINAQLIAPKSNARLKRVIKGNGEIETVPVRSPAMLVSADVWSSLSRNYCLPGENAQHVKLTYSLHSQEHVQQALHNRDGDVFLTRKHPDILALFPTLHKVLLLQSIRLRRMVMPEPLNEGLRTGEELLRIVYFLHREPALNQ